MDRETPSMQLGRHAREEAERRRLVDIAFSVLPPPPPGIQRLMWFGDSDTPMPVEVPDAVMARLQSISAEAFGGQAVLFGLSPRQAEAIQLMDEITKPYIDAQYPTLSRNRRKARSDSWWLRLLRKCGFRA